MKRLFESIQVLGQVIGLIMGSNFTMPCDETIEFDRYSRFGY